MGSIFPPAQGAGTAAAANSLTGSLTDEQVPVASSAPGVLDASSITDDGTTVKVAEAFQQGSAQQFQLSAVGLPTKANNIALTGQGFSLVVGKTFEKPETGSDANVHTYTPGAADEQDTLDIAIDVSAEVAGIGNLQVSLSYEDSNGSPVSGNVISFFGVGVNGLAAITAAGNYWMCVPLNIKTGTNLVVGAVFSGTSIAYKISTTLKRNI